MTHRERIDELLATYAQGWTLDRMPAVDRAVLRLGAWELLFNDEVPDAVAIDEAVELARSLSTDESPGVRERPARPAAGGQDRLNAGPPRSAGDHAPPAFGREVPHS